jgi:hypothetical protein
MNSLLGNESTVPNFTHTASNAVYTSVQQSFLNITLTRKYKYLKFFFVYVGPELPQMVVLAVIVQCLLIAR